MTQAHYAIEPYTTTPAVWYVVHAPPQGNNYLTVTVFRFRFIVMALALGGQTLAILLYPSIYFSFSLMELPSGVIEWHVLSNIVHHSTVASGYAGTHLRRHIR